MFRILQSFPSRCFPPSSKMSFPGACVLRPPPGGAGPQRPGGASKMSFPDACVLRGVRLLGSGSCGVRFPPNGLRCDSCPSPQSKCFFIYLFWFTVNMATSLWTAAFAPTDNLGSCSEKAREFFFPRKDSHKEVVSLQVGAVGLYRSWAQRPPKPPSVRGLCRRAVFR